jgi:hypothetical protein
VRVFEVAVDAQMVLDLLEREGFGVRRDRLSDGELVKQLL